MKRLTSILLFGLLSFRSVFPQSPSLIGPQGLIFTPTSHAFQDGHLDFGYTNLKEPNIFIKWGDKTTQNHLFYTTFVFLPRLGLTGLLSLAPGSDGNDNSDMYKDFAIFAQYHVLKETAARPGITLGLWDFHSYSYYNALFVACSKKINLSGNFKIYTHFGYGVDWIKTHWGDTGPDRNDPVNHHLLGMFGGLEISLNPMVTILLEYDTSRINGGLNIFLLDRFKIMISTLNFNSMSFGMNFGGSLLPAPN